MSRIDSYVDRTLSHIFFIECLIRENGEGTIRCLMAQQDSDITPAILLKHMQAMEQRLGGRIDGVKNDVQRLEIKSDRSHALLSNQIATIDQRLDAVEIEYLPKRVTRLEKVVGVGQ